jgi:hypothetical protein
VEERRWREMSVRIISATLTTSMSRSGIGGTVGRMQRTIIALGVSAIDVFRTGEDQMITNGTLFKGEVPVTHLREGGEGKGGLRPEA